MRFFIALFLVFSSASFAQEDRIQIKNNTSSDVFIEDVGRGVVASATESIDPANYLLYSVSEDIDDLIDANTVDILLNTVTLPNDEAKEIIHSLRINRVSKTSGTQVTDVLRTEFDGPSVSVTNEGNGTAKVTVDLGITRVGHIFSKCFSRSGSAKNKWLGNDEKNISSNISPHPLVWDSTLIAASYTSSEDRSDVDIEIRAANLNAGNSDTLRYNWHIRDSRTSVINTLSVDFNGGDKVGVYAKDMGEDAKDVVVCLYFKVRTDNTIDTDEEWDNDL